MVQILFWLVFAVNWSFGFTQLPDFNIVNWSIIGCVFAISILGINIIIPKLSKERLVSHLKQEINSLKADEEVFKVFLKKQAHFEVNKSDSKILLGNPDASLFITVLTNPYCNPCARMHKRVEKLLKDTNNDICVQYILSSFDISLESTNKYLIAACFGENTTRQIFSDWFEKGKSLKDDFFKDLDLDINNPDIETEFQKHELWREKTKLRATPTILVNGYQLPDNYKIEDLRYFTKLAINVD
jgi:thiol-disulfide isomerase/thioredoxin